jgi:hypothetical protein
MVALDTVATTTSRAISIARHARLPRIHEYRCEGGYEAHENQLAEPPGRSNGNGRQRATIRGIVRCRDAEVANSESGQDGGFGPENTAPGARPGDALDSRHALRLT